MDILMLLLAGVLSIWMIIYGLVNLNNSKKSKAIQVLPAFLFNLPAPPPVIPKVISTPSPLVKLMKEKKIKERTESWKKEYYISEELPRKIFLDEV
jgi:hypothetical protein